MENYFLILLERGKFTSMGNGVQLFLVKTKYCLRSEISEISNDEPSNLRYKSHLGRQWTWSLRCSWSIAFRHCSNDIFFFELTPGFDGLGKDNCKTIHEKHFSFLDLLQPILHAWRYVYSRIYHEDICTHLSRYYVCMCVGLQTKGACFFWRVAARYICIYRYTIYIYQISLYLKDMNFWYDWCYSCILFVFAVKWNCDKSVVQDGVHKSWYYLLPSALSTN